MARDKFQFHELIEMAVRLPAERRDAFLRELCSADEDLLQRVLERLRIDEARHEGPTADMESRWVAADDTAGRRQVRKPGRGLPEPELEGGHLMARANLARIGPYRIISQVGRGGMGTVFLAIRDDDAFKRKVAIKLISRGMDTD